MLTIVTIVAVTWSNSSPHLDKGATTVGFISPLFFDANGFNSHPHTAWLPTLVNSQNGPPPPSP